MRYYIATIDCIPYHAQPEKGYTKLQVIARIHREAKEDARLFGGHYTDYIHNYSILDTNFKEATEIYSAL